MIAPQLTADADDSGAAASSVFEEENTAIPFSYLKKSMRMMMIGIGMPKNQSRIPRPM